MIDPYLIIFYQKKNFEILTNFTQTRFPRPTRLVCFYTKKCLVGGCVAPPHSFILQNCVVYIIGLQCQSRKFE